MRPRVSEYVLDASAVLAFLNQETGHEVVSRLLDRAAVSAVNVAEVGTKLADDGFTEGEIRATIEGLGLEIIALEATISYRVASLRGPTRAKGLSLGDRACLATAERLGVPTLTTDRTWAGLEVGVEIRVIR